MIFQVTSKRKLDQIDAALKESAQRHKFGVISILDLKEKMKEKGVDFANECMIYEVCNPQQAKRVLEANPAVSTALPCRISVYGEGGCYRIATLLPTKLLGAFEATADIQQVAREVEDVVVQMMRDAA